MKVSFHTNLDEPKLPHDMGNSFDHVPAKGSYFAILYHGYEVELEVVGVRYSQQVKHGVYNMARIELHIPSYRKWSIIQWEEWLKRLKENPR